MNSTLYALVFYILPYSYITLYPLLLLSTLSHELAHGISALLIGCQFNELIIDIDCSGQVLISGNISKLGKAFIAVSGILSPSICSCLCFFLVIFINISRFIMLIFGLLLLYIELIYIRFSYSLFFITLLSLALIYISIKARDWLVQLSIIFAGIQLAISVLAKFDYFFLKYINTSNGLILSDVSKISESLCFPYWFWGFICFILSISIVLLGLIFLIKNID